MPSSPSSSPIKASSPSPKRAVFFPLENILIPGPFVSSVDASKSRRFLKSLSSYARKKEVSTFLISAFPRTIALEKVLEFGLSDFFSEDTIFAVDDDYLEKMEPLDRARYDSKLKDNPACTDEYYRQVAMQNIMKKNSFSPAQCLLVGNDFWFDGFYTRRYSQVDVVFVEPSFTSRGKMVSEKISGLWYAPLSPKPFEKILAGKMTLPNYKPLDTWASITLTEELLGAQNFNMVKRVILEKKKDGTFHHVSTSGSVSPLSKNNDEINPPFT